MRLVVSVVSAVAIVVTAVSHVPSAFATQRAIPSATETFEVGMLRVERFGSAGRTPIIFIPALFCGASQWQREISVLSNRYDVYAITLPGFDGRARDTGGDLMSRAVADISTLIKSRHLDRPILVGHSLGGTIAILFASQHSGDIRGVIAAEGGYPAGATQAERERSVAASTAPYRNIDRTAFGDSLRAHMLQYVITKKSDVDSVQRTAARSDPAAVVDWLSAALSLDLTPQLYHIGNPLTEIVPFDTTVDPYVGFASLAAKTAAYQKFLARAPRASLVMIDHARHFVMIDQPEKFDRALYAAIEADAKGS
ncbi:MAG TPA: alpha/beta hydrolase [Gemmatimonadaceae bacterium]|nr:alpha/beta hydrolase [Gemmatimonadaceae bacterium]